MQIRAQGDVSMGLASGLERIWYRANPYTWLLVPLSAVYRCVTDLRRLAYRCGIRPVTTLSVPVVVVGNLTVGGTGKTPMVIWLARALLERGYRVGIVSRGYRGRSGDWPQAVDGTSDPGVVGDEPVLLARATGCPVSVGPDRVAAARALLALEQVDVLLADDGLQHYALGRVMEVVVVDGERGFGNGFCLPAGPLRERKDRLRRVGAVVVNGGNWSAGDVFRASTRPRDVYQLAGSARRSLADFRGAQVHAVAAIGNPSRFFRMLEEAGLRVLAHPMPDHAVLNVESISFHDSLPVLVTEKDAVKCQRFAHDDLWCVPIELTFDTDATERLVARVLGHIKECRWISP